MSFISDMQPHQILCLEHQDTSLYGEVIQVINERNLCWLRPIVLVQRKQQDLEDTVTLFDLHQGADLLYPLTLFRIALDTEVLPILVQLESLKTEQSPAASPEASRIAHQQLQHFIRQIWQANPDSFRQQ